MRPKTLGLVFIIFSAFIPPVMALYPLFIFSKRSYAPEAIIIMIALLTIGIVLQIADRDKLSEKRMEIIDKQFPCPVCKKDVFTWGKVPSAQIRIRVGLGQPAWARICQNCGNVQQFTKTD